MPNESLSYYLDRYVMGVITPDEWSVFQTLLRDPNNDVLLDEALDEVLATIATKSAKDPDLVLRLQRAVDQEIEREKQVVPSPVRRIPLYRRWWAAASIVLLLAAAAYFWVGHKNDTEPVAVVHRGTDVAPGKDGAVLTLADGSQVVLDSLGNGVIAAQNGAEVVLKDGMLAYNPTGETPGETIYNTITTPKGRKFSVVLPDGTKVWLNAASSITYPTVFNGIHREVKVFGEAYLEVVKDKAHPFIVEIAGKSVVEVLGTSFNVNAYANEKEVKTTLIEGRVRVNTTGASLTNNSIILKPGEQAIVAATGDVVVNTAADLSQTLAWKNGLFNFNNADLHAAMRQLERWYDIDVQYNKEVPNIILKGEMYRDVNLSDVLEFLRDMGFRFRIEGKTLIVL